MNTPDSLSPSNAVEWKHIHARLIEEECGRRAVILARKPLLPGYKALGGTSRSYVDPLGAVISRREYSKREGNPLVPKYDFTMTRYNDLLSQFIDRKVQQGDYTYIQVDPKTGEPKRYTRGEKKGQYKEKRGAARQSSEMKTAIKDLRSKDNSPTGKKAKALEKLGRRDPEWDMPVGESPGKVE